MGHQKTQTVCLIILAVGMIGAGLFYLQSVLLPFVIAFFLVVGCRPIAEYFERKLRLHHLLAFAVTFIVGISILAFFAILTFISIQDLARNQEKYEGRLIAIAKWLDKQILEQKKKDQKKEDENKNKKKSHTPANSTPPVGNIQAKSEPETVKPESEVKEPLGQETANQETANQETGDQEPPFEPPAEEDDAIGRMVDQSTNFMKSVFLSLAGSLTSLLSYAVLILIYVFFLLLGNDSSTKQPELVVQIESKIRQYLVVKTVISAVTGLVFGLILWLFGVPLAIVFGLLAFLLNFIPNIGPLISTLIPVPFLILNSEMNPTAAIICFVLIAAVQFVSGNVVETKVMGEAFDVNPIVLLLALMFFGQIWGIVGMFLATPIISVIKIVLDQNENTKGLGNLLAGRLDLLAGNKT